MCLQISYTLTCEHVKTQTIYCADAQPVPASAAGWDHCSHHHHRKSHKKDNKKSSGSGSGSGSGGGSGVGGGSRSSKKKKSFSPTSPTPRPDPASPALAPSSGFPSSPAAAVVTAAVASASPSARGAGCKMLPCRNLTQQSLPYPTPPSFACDPQTAATSLLAPKCPLPDCPFEVKNRCWNCCWCGKGWNERGRCSCVMIIEGNEVQCEHICCPECEAAEA